MPWVVLGISQDAENRAIDKAYKAIGVLVHPYKQKGQRKAEAENASSMIVDAKDVMMKHEKTVHPNLRHGLEISGGTHEHLRGNYM